MSNIRDFAEDIRTITLEEENEALKAALARCKQQRDSFIARSLKDLDRAAPKVGCIAQEIRYQNDELDAILKGDKWA